MTGTYINVRTRTPEERRWAWDNDLLVGFGTGALDVEYVAALVDEDGRARFHVRSSGVWECFDLTTPPGIRDRAKRLNELVRDGSHKSCAGWVMPIGGGPIVDDAPTVPPATEPAARAAELDAERETFQRLERELVEHDVSLFLTACKGGQPKLEAVVDGRALRHEGPLTLGLARLLNLLEGR